MTETPTTKIVEEIFTEILIMLKNRYEGNKLLRGKYYTAAAYKRAYLDVKKIKKRWTSNATVEILSKQD